MPSRRYKYVMQNGDLRLNNLGELEIYYEGYWQPA